MPAPSPLPKNLSISFFQEVSIHFYEQMKFKIKPKLFNRVMSFFSFVASFFTMLCASSFHSTPAPVGVSVFSEQTSLFLISRAFALSILSDWDAFLPDYWSFYRSRSPSSHLDKSVQMTCIKYPFPRIFNLAWVSRLFGLSKKGSGRKLMVLGSMTLALPITCALENSSIFIVPLETLRICNGKVKKQASHEPK